MNEPGKTNGNGHIQICVGPNDIGDPPMPEILEYEQQIRPEVEQTEETEENAPALAASGVRERVRRARSARAVRDDGLMLKIPTAARQRPAVLGPDEDATMPPSEL
jgi:hypothetical protein